MLCLYFSIISMRVYKYAFYNMIYTLDGYQTSMYPRLITYPISFPVLLASSGIFLIADLPPGSTHRSGCPSSCSLTLGLFSTNHKSRYHLPVGKDSTSPSPPCYWSSVSSDFIHPRSYPCTPHSTPTHTLDELGV